MHERWIGDPRDWLRGQVNLHLRTRGRRRLLHAVADSAPEDTAPKLPQDRIRGSPAGRPNRRACRRQLRRGSLSAGDDDIMQAATLT